MSNEAKITITGKELQENLQVRTLSIVGNSLPSMLDPYYGHNFPPFRIQLVPTILQDSRIRFGLGLIKGPIQNFTLFFEEEEADNPQLHQILREQGTAFPYVVKTKNKEVSAYVIKTMRKLWERGIVEALTAIEWGFSCSEVLCKRSADKKRLDFNGLRLFHPFSVKPLVLTANPNMLAGAEIRGLSGGVGGVRAKIGKIFWHVHARDINPVLGDSRLRGSFVPWHETWVCYGARDIRRTWFHRNSFDGGQMKYPIGFSKDVNGNQVSNDALAAQIMSSKRTGGYIIVPDEINTAGKPRWEYTPPAANPTPQGLMEYPEQLRFEILEGLGIPPEVIESTDDGGHGSATGRKVPMVMYYSTLCTLVSNLITDFEIPLRVLVNLNFGTKNTDYSIERLIPLKAEDPNSLPGNTPGGIKPKKTDVVTDTVKDSSTGLSS